MKTTIAIFFLLLCALLTGCAAQLIGNAIGQGQNLTPEQIEAYRKIGSQVYYCFQIGGPPPAGNMQLILVPLGSPAPRFGDNCHVVGIDAPTLVSTPTTTTLPAIPVPGKIP